MAYSASSKFTYSELHKKHEEFVGPEFKVFVNGSELSTAEFNIPGVNIIIPLTIGQRSRRPESGECTFDIVGMFDLEATAFQKNLEDRVKVGKQLEVKGGYRNPQTLFMGVITSVDVNYAVGGVVVSVTAMDAFSMMGGYKQSQAFNKQNPAQTVRELLTPYTSDAPKKAKLGTIAQLDPVKVDLTRTEMKDIEFLYFLARRFQKNLAIIHGEILFDDLLKNTTPIGTLTYGQNLLSFRKQLDTSRQYGKVEVMGYDANKKPIKGQATSVSVGGTGDTAADLDSAIKKRTMQLTDKIARSEQELNAIAQAMLNESALSFVSGRGTCIGIPELTPGRYIELGGMSKSTNGTYFITRVTHSFGADGFTTSFDIKGAKTQ